MSLRAQYWTRVAIVGVLSMLLNLVADRLLDVPMNSGRDWLIYFAIMLPSMYFFVWKWSDKVGYGR